MPNRKPHPEYNVPGADEAFGELLGYEAAWRDRQAFLQAQGYMLRPRLRPNWVPSWRKSPAAIIESEDGVVLPMRRHLVDATHISDGTLVYIKRVHTGDEETLALAKMNSTGVKDDPRNHAVRILDYFQDDVDNTISYIVMPFLLPIDEPPMERVGECIDFVTQFLEGLICQHEAGVAHRDLSEKNLLIEASALYPQGHHPVKLEMLPDLSGLAPALPRWKLGVRYLYVDFGISTYFPPGSTQRLVTGILGRNQNVPELSKTVPYDPFKVDIFSLGQVFERVFTKTYTNTEFLRPLIKSMTARDPAARPSAAEAFSQWTEMSKSVGSFRRVLHLREREGPMPFTFVLDTINIFRALPPCFHNSIS
ncbi:hypothetical protein PENSPDRAFT_609710 [Peniophora sp. CONT]|nr:hypothetical protein PENSPDRAFT_609710 [Peniophora sp. CONT]